MNTVAANELKRQGIAVIEKRLAKGPVHVIKRNRAVCVVLSEEEYARLTHAAGASPARQTSVMEWFALPPIGTATKEELDARLSRERDQWDHR